MVSRSLDPFHVECSITPFEQWVDSYEECPLRFPEVLWSDMNE